MNFRIIQCTTCGVAFFAAPSKNGAVRTDLLTCSQCKSIASLVDRGLTDIAIDTPDAGTKPVISI